MRIDKVSRKLISVALYLDSIDPGAVSELWISPALKKELKADVPKEIDLDKLSFELNSEITLLLDKERKAYLSAVAKSIIFQITEVLENRQSSFADFNKHCFGIMVRRASDVDIKRLDDRIIDLENRLRMTRYEVIEKNLADRRSLTRIFSDNLATASEKLPPFLQLPDEAKFSVSTTSRKPWSAFNKHTAPFTSELILNKDVSFTNLDLLQLAAHEGFGGHHTELSLKDNLLMREERGEHGIVITFSPQTFISEAIAESAYQIFEVNPATREAMLLWYYNRLLMAVQNIATYLHFDDGRDKKEVRTELEGMDIREEDLDQAIGFATDKRYGRYAHVYFAAFNFMTDLYRKTEDKEALLRRVYTRPVTPNMLLSSHLA